MTMNVRVVMLRDSDHNRFDDFRFYQAPLKSTVKTGLRRGDRTQVMMKG